MLIDDVPIEDVPIDVPIDDAPIEDTPTAFWALSACPTVRVAATTVTRIARIISVLR